MPKVELRDGTIIDVESLRDLEELESDRMDKSVGQQDQADVAPQAAPQGMTGQQAVGQAMTSQGQQTSGSNPYMGAGMAGAGALAMGATPAGAAVLAGSMLVSGLAKQRAQREAQRIQNEMERRKRVADLIQTGTQGKSIALQNAINNMGRALL